MNVSEFVVNKLVPKKEDFMTFSIYGDGEVMESKLTLEGLLEAVPRLVSIEKFEELEKKNPGSLKRLLKAHGMILDSRFDEEAFEQAKRDLEKEKIQAKVDFRQALAIDFGMVEHPKEDSLYALSCDMAKSAKLEDIASQYAKLVQLVL